MLRYVFDASSGFFSSTEIFSLHFSPRYALHAVQGRGKQEEQPEELQFLLEGIKGQTDSTFLRQLMNTERLTADEIKYFVNRVGIDWIRTKLNDDEYGYMADRYLDVPSI